MMTTNISIRAVGYIRAKHSCVARRYIPAARVAPAVKHGYRTPISTDGTVTEIAVVTSVKMDRNILAL